MVSVPLLSWRDICWVKMSFWCFSKRRFKKSWCCILLLARNWQEKFYNEMNLFTAKNQTLRSYQGIYCISPIVIHHQLLFEKEKFCMSVYVFMYTRACDTDKEQTHQRLLHPTIVRLKVTQWLKMKTWQCIRHQVIKCINEQVNMLRD